MVKWIKKNAVLIGTTIGLLLLSFLCGSSSNKRRVSDGDGLADQGAELREGIDRSLDEIDGEREALRENHRAIGTANKSVRSELEYAIRILENAKERAVSAGS